MDKQLAEMYGTLDTETDTEKLAAAQLAEALSDTDEEEQVKVADLTDEQVEQLAEAVLAHIMGAEEKPEEKNEAKVEAKEDEEQVEEKEEEKVEAKAEEKEEAKADESEEKPEEEKKASAEPSEDDREKLAEADFLGRVMAHAFTNELKLIKHASEEQPEEQKASALDTLAEQRAIEILQANGIDPETMNPVEEEPAKTAASEEEMAALDQKVTQRAMEMLQSLGFEFEDAAEEK